MSKLTFVTVLLSMFTLQGFSAAKGVAQEALVGYWPFDEGTGKEVKDASGNGNDGAFFGDPKWVDGMHGKALDFAGESYVIVPDDDLFDITDTLTIMAWFKVTSPLAAAPCNSRMMSKNASYHVHFDFGASTNAVELLVKPNNDFVESQTEDWDPGEWYHFAGTFDSGTMKIYINGELEGETENAAGIAPSNLELWIGGDDWKPCFFPGMLDEVRIYNKALAEVEINEAMKGPVAVQSGGKLPVTWGMIKERH